ncbi:hypothetical protein SAMN05216249_10922 [Acetitomaculum ruminis DSM 5522]|uniref:Type II secretion system (T2SS), protein F n=1 Tax=Acetitomaculum ruminis DSM 5522 TaxID=1120918 RepID=A0A1I0Y8M3_9FIRM|nr:hypothetical protein [Acetitomaculum ruminis]SFB09542.1 hypothetical protein SAMN05216249_10922 [Acetitomaculum ruminis DSM 5522]
MEKFINNLSGKIYEKFFVKYIFKNDFVKNDSLFSKLKILKPEKSTEELKKDFICGKLNLVLKILLITFLLSFMALLGGIVSSKVEGNKIERGDYGEDSEEYNLKLYDEKSKKYHDIDFYVSSKSYSEKEFEKLCKQNEKAIIKKFIGENKDKNHINKKVEFFDTIMDGLFEVTFSLEDFELLDSQGNIEEEKVGEKGKKTKVYVTLDYEEFSYNFDFEITVFKPESDSVGGFLKKIKSQLLKEDSSSKSNSYFSLPKKSGDNNLKWKEPLDFTWVKIFILGIVLSIAVYIAKNKEIERQMEFRKRQMLIDYPEIVSKITIFLSLGLSVPTIWKNIIKEYEIQRKNGREVRYAYEEMLISFYEMEKGMSLPEALERFGRRCQIHQYIKLSALISQNLRIGSKEIKKLLSKEVIDSFEMRKNLARKTGEEASTKLLIPMVMMLMVVMIIIVVPAFMSFNL